jgi:outer membrane biosynthesis protein TonB
MNLRNTLLAAVLSLGTLTAAAAGEKAELAGEGGLQEQIRQEITFPAFLKNKPQTEEVKVSFTIDENGKAVLLSVNTGNTALEKYVRQKMQAMTFAAMHRNGKVHNMNLVFKLI